MILAIFCFLISKKLLHIICVQEKGKKNLVSLVIMKQMKMFHEISMCIPKTNIIIVTCFQKLLLKLFSKSSLRKKLKIYFDYISLQLHYGLYFAYGG
jgi:hypothetical protein